MRKFLLVMAAWLLSVGSFAADFNIVGTWYQYEWDVETLDGIWVFNADGTGTVEEFHHGVSEGVSPMTYTFDAATNNLKVYSPEEPNDPFDITIRIDSPTQFTYVEGHESLTWYKQSSGDVPVPGSHAIADKASSFKMLTAKDGLTYNFAYDDQGRYSKITMISNGVPYEVLFTYKDNQILLQRQVADYSATFDMSVVNDRVVQEQVSIVMNGVQQTVNTLTYEYDTDNQLTKIVSSSDLLPEVNHVTKLTWQDGNIIKAEIVGSQINETIEFTYYSEYENQSIVQAFSGSIDEIWTEMEVLSSSPFMLPANYLGKVCRNLMKSLHFTGYNSNEPSLDKTREVTYTFTADGHVEKCKIGSREFLYTWDASSGVAAPRATVNQPEAVYSLDGRRQTSLGRGLNIIRRADGTTIKMIRK